MIEGAAREGDPELLASFLSGREPAWSEAWEQLARTGVYQNREAFGLTWLPDDPGTAVITTTLNPQFNSAEVTVEQQYSFNVGNGLTETVRLWQTAVYRRGPDRWLLSPPEAEFWGDTLTKEGFYLTLTYPERDRETAECLALDLDTALAALCANPTFECPEALHLQVEFSTDPASLSPEYGSAVFVDEGWLLRLPTPTLAGLPTDEAGYQVIARGYAAQLLLVVMRQLFGLPATTEGPFQEAWQAWQLDQFALRPYPLSPADWQTLAEEEATLAEGEQLWATGEPANPFAYALIAFLIEELHIPPRTIMEFMVNGEARIYEEWLVKVGGGPFPFDELETRWQAFLDSKQSAVD